MGKWSLVIALVFMFGLQTSGQTAEPSANNLEQRIAAAVQEAKRGLKIKKALPSTYEINGFALKVGRWCSFGFAAGCAAVAMPRRTRAFYLWAAPLVRPLAQSEGKARTMGRARK